MCVLLTMAITLPPHPPYTPIGVRKMSQMYIRCVCKAGSATV